MNGKNRTEWKNMIRRKVAAFMTVLMALETPLTAWAAIGSIAGSGDFLKWDIKDNGKPSSAFSELVLTTGGKVGEDNTFFVGFDGSLNDEWRMDQYELFLDGGGIDEETWDLDESVREAYPDCPDYYAYLDSLGDDDLKEISFTCTFSNEDAEGEEVFSVPGGMGADILVTEGEHEGEKLGSYTVKRQKNRVVLTGTFLRSAYYLTDVTFGFSGNLEFNRTYREGTEITVTPGTGNSDFTVTPNSEGEESFDQTGYSIKKTAKAEGKTGILYTISAGLAATGSNATGRIASVSSATDRSASASSAGRRTADRSASASSADSRSTGESVGTYAAGYPSVERQREVVRRSKARRRAQAAASPEDDEEEGYYEEEEEDEEDDGDFPGDPNAPDDFNGPGVYGLSSVEISLLKNGAPRAASSSDGEEERDLAGKVITDRIPENLVITRVMASLNGGEPGQIYTNVSEASGSDCEVDAGNLLRYVIPAEDSAGRPVRSAVLEIHTQLSDDVYKEYLAAGQEFEMQFPNRAYLKGEDKETLALSERVNPVIRLEAPFSKEGKPLDPSNKSFRWTLNINSEFGSPDRVTLYAVDHLVDIENTHMYRSDLGAELSGLDIWRGKADEGEPDHRDIFNGGELTGTAAEDYAYGNVDGISVIREILGKLPNLVPQENENDAILYTYAVTREGKAQKDAVLLIPLSGYADGEVKITYVTDATIPDYTQESDFPDEYEKELKNDARILWRWDDGSGVGEGEEYGSADLTKTYPVRYSLVKKTAYDPRDPDRKSGYDKDSNTVTWYFEVNQLAVEGITSLDITDELADEELKLLDPAGDEGGKLILYPITDERRSDGGIRKTRAMGVGEREVSYWDGQGEAPGGDYYRLILSVGNPEGKSTTTFRLHLAGEDGGPALRAEEHYYFTLKTQVMKLNAQGSSNVITIKNEAAVQATVGEKPVEFETSADCQVDNTLIIKKSIPVRGDGKNGLYYDYTDNTVKWRVTINPSRIALQDVTLVDDLPVGTRLAAWTGAGYGETVDTEPEKAPVLGQAGVWTANLTPPAGSGSTVTVIQMEEVPASDSNAAYAKNHLKVTFLGDPADGGDGEVILDRPITVEFTTHVEESYRKGAFSSDKKNPNYKITLDNKATLTGKAAGGEAEFSAWDTAKNTLTPQPLIKSGQYAVKTPVTVDGVEKELSAVKWSLLVNRTCAEIGGAVLTDRVPDCMELVPDTVKVEAVKLGADGSVDEGSAVVLYDRTSVPPVDAANAIFKFRSPDADVAETASRPMDCTGFACTVPGDTPVQTAGEGDVWKDVKISGATLRLTFTTVMVEDAYASEITNNVSLKGAGVTDETGNIGAQDSHDFYTDSYATAKGVYFTKIYKSSVNEEGKYPLNGTEFRIEKLVTPNNGAGSTSMQEWQTVDTTPGARNKTRVTNRRGNVTFMFLRPNAMYRITESRAHDGYKTPEDRWYVVIKPDSPSGSGGAEPVYPEPVKGDEGNKVTVDGKEVPYHLYIHDTGLSGAKNYISLDIKNQVDQEIGGKCSFELIKKGQGGQLLQGVEFVLSRRNFKDRTAVSDEDGKVKFELLDPNKDSDWYTLTEKPTPGYKTAEPIRFRLKLKADGQGGFTSDVEYGNNDDSAFDTNTEAGAPVLINAPITGGGSFEKTDQNGERITEPRITFKVYRRGDGGEALKSESGYDPTAPMLVIDVDGSKKIPAANKKEYKEYLKESEVTTENGVVTFNNYPYGDYKFQEVAPASSDGDTLPLIPNQPAAEVYIHIDGDGVWAVPASAVSADTGKPDLSAPGVVKIRDKDGKETGMTCQAVNRLQYGFVQIHKVAGEKDENGVISALKNSEGELLSLKDAKFNIYRDVDEDEEYDSSKETEALIQNLATDETGRFAIQPDSAEGSHDGVYKDSKVQLTVGKYLLTEVTPPDGFEVLKDGATGKVKVYPFEIAPWGTGVTEPQTVYVGEPPAGAAPSGDSEKLLYNLPLRKPVLLTKGDKDSESVRLPGAEFEVCVRTAGVPAAEKTVAYLVPVIVADAGEQAGQYHLSNRNSAGNEVAENNPQGVPYLCKKPGAGPDRPYELLKGSYYIKETSVPENYRAPGTEFRYGLTIGDDGFQVTGDGTKDGIILQNEIIKHEVRVQKLIETVSVNGSSSAHEGYEPGVGFTFILRAASDDEAGAGDKGGPVNGAAFAFQKVITAGEGSAVAGKGEAIFKNIPLGTYVLSETDVPDRYKHKNAAGEDEWAVAKMPDILVRVTKDGVGYERAGEGQPAGTWEAIGKIDTKPTAGPQQRQEPGLRVYKDGEAEALLAVYNNFFFGSASGVKTGALAGAGAADGGIKLGGAKFELRSDAKSGTAGGQGASGGIYTLTSTSTAGGEIAFTGVPYGEYILTELEAPEGYAVAEPVKVSVYGDDVPLQTAGQTDGRLVDEALTRTVKFRKVDQNGDPLGSGRIKTAFKVERVSVPDGAVLPAFTAREGIENDENGIVTVEALPYGTYKVTETAAVPAQVSSPLPSFYIQVGPGTAGAPGTTGTKVTLSGGRNMDGVDAVSMEKEDYVIQEGTKVLNTEPFDFSREAAGSTAADRKYGYAVTNTVKYGTVNIRKTAADDAVLNGEVMLRPTDSALAGVVFEIYEDSGTVGQKDGSDRPVLTAVTGADGRFKMDGTRRYLDKDGRPQDYRLVYGGTYLLHEKSLPESLRELYRVDEGYYPFKIGETTAGEDGTAGTVYIGTERTEVKPDAPGEPEGITSAEGTRGENFRFPNGPLVRGTVELVKTDPETAAQGRPAKPVSGARFDVYALDGSAPGGAVRAAMLREDGAPGAGIYKLYPGAEADGYVPKNSSGQEYVKTVEGAYRLLCGSYYIKETKAPDGYRAPADTADQYWYFTVDKLHREVKNEDLTADPAGGAARKKEFTNTLWRRDVIVEKQVEQFERDTFRAPKAADGVFTFRLRGTPVNRNTPLERTAQVALTGVDAGKAVFKDIPSGTYTLTEEWTGTLPAPDGRRMEDVYQPPVPITVTVDGNGVTYDRGDGEGSVTAGSKPVTVQNRLKRGSIAGEKLTRDGSGTFALAGAVLKVRRLDAAGNAADGARTAVSKADGSFVFENLPLGNYELKEITAPAGYLLDDRSYKVTVGTAGEKVTAADDGAVLRLINEASGTITIAKTAEVMEGTDLTGVQRPGEGFLFCVSGTSFEQQDITELYAASALKVLGAIDVQAREDGPEGRGLYVVTGSSGRVTVSGLPVGEYRVAEAENEKNDAAGLYVRDERRRDAAITVDHRTGKVTGPVVTVENRMKRSEIRGLKTTDGGTPLAGAVIGLFPADAAGYTEAELYRGRKVTTGEDGTFTFTGIPAGEYRIRELEAPAGYRLNTDTVYKVKVTEDKAIITRGEGPGGETDIRIANTRRSSGGDGGGGDNKPDVPNNPENPVGPGAPTEPETLPGETLPGETLPGETLPGETSPGETPPVIPVEPDPDNTGGTVITTPPDTPPNTGVIIEDPDGEEVYRGRTDENRQVHVTLPPGDYTLITIDDNEVPLGQMLFTIEDGEVPLGRMAPDAGDHSIPLAMLAMIFLAAVTGTAVVYKKRKELDQGGNDSDEDGSDRNL